MILNSGAELADVADVNVRALEAHRGDDLGQKLARRTDERLALPLFLGTRSLTDEHDPGVGVPDGEDHRAAKSAECARFFGILSHLREPGEFFLPAVALNLGN